MAGSRPMRKIAPILLLSLAILAIPLVTPANAVMFPICSTSFRIQVFPTFMTAAEPSGSFGIAGCAHPYGSQVKVYFKDFFNRPVNALPNATAPLLLTSRTTDGHFHAQFRLPATFAAPGSQFSLNALLQGCCSYTYSFAWVRPYCLVACASTTAGAVRFIYVAWTGPSAPSGAFTAFVDAKISRAHIRIYFVDRQTGGAVSGLPSQASPWAGQVFLDGRLMKSFRIMSNQGLDTTIYNMNAVMFVEEDASTTVWPIWIHKPIPMA